VIANGRSPVENVSKVLIIILCCCAQLLAQKSTPLSIQDALLEIAKEHKLSLVFNTDNIPNQQVELSRSNTSTSQLESILRNTNLEYRIEANQIFLFVKRNIFGYVEDAGSGERLIAATIYIPETNDYAIANEQGYFSFSTIKDSIAIEVSYLGFSTLSQTISKAQMDQPIVLRLDTDSDIKEVIISDLAATAVEQNYIELNKGSDILLHQNQAVSAIGGEPDIFQAMMRQTGVNAGTDGIGGMHVRGGKNDQNLILFDGVKLYNSAHAFGAMSIVNSGIVDQARMFKSGANGSRFGRLSSVMDVKTKDPNLSNVKGSIQMTTIASQASLELPIIKDQFGLMVSTRRTHIDPYIRSKSSESKLRELEPSIGETNYNFYDLNVKGLAKINSKNRLYLSLYKGQDRYDDNDLIDVVYDFGDEHYLDKELYYDWENKFASLRYNALIGTNTIANLQLSSYRYQYNNFLEEDEEIFDFGGSLFYRDYVEFESGIQHDEAKVDLQTITDNHHVSYGMTLGKKKYNVGVITLELFEDEIDFTQPIPIADFLIIDSIGIINSKEYTFYLADKYKVNNSWLLDAGVYFTLYNSIGEFYYDDDYVGRDFHGYLKTIFQINNKFSIGGALSSNVQVEHLLTTSDNGYPNDICVPSSSTLRPERSNQFELFATVKSSHHNLRLSTYAKRQENIIFYDGVRALPSLTWRPTILTCRKINL